MRTISIDGLTDEQVARVQAYADLLRRAGPREVAAARILSRLDEERQSPPMMSDEEADALATEALAWARGHH